MLRELVIVSGKGGTGKTSVTAAFASLAKNSVLCDADVDAADLHLLMQPEVHRSTDFMGGCLADIRNDDCVECGRCIELCRFDAISEDYVVDYIMYHEMLHILHPFKRVNGRRVIHSKQFKAQEILFKKYVS